MKVPAEMTGAMWNAGAHALHSEMLQQHYRQVARGEAQDVPCEWRGKPLPPVRWHCWQSIRDWLEDVGATGLAGNLAFCGAIWINKGVGLLPFICFMAASILTAMKMVERRGKIVAGRKLAAAVRLKDYLAKQDPRLRPVN